MNSPDIEKNSFSAALALCENIAQEISPAKHMCRGLRLRGMLKKSFSDTKKIFLRAENYSETSAALSDAFLWLTDNYSFIEEEFRYCICTLKKKKGTASKNGLPFVYEASMRLFSICDGDVSGTQIDALAASCDSTIPSGMGYDDFCSFSHFLKCALLSYIGGISAKFSGSDAVFQGDESGDRLISAIKTLKYLSVHNFTESFSLCKLERILSNDPAGVYPVMTENSSSELRRLLHFEAKSSGMSDSAYAEKLYDLSVHGKSNAEKYIGYNVGKLPSERKLYFPLLYGLSAAVSTLASYYVNIWLFPLLFFPLLDALKPALDAVISMICKNTGLIPAIKLSEIPENAKTLCVITALLRGEEHDGELFTRLERIYNANSGKNIKFGLLCDLCDNDGATKSTDEAVAGYARGRIDSLNAKYGNDFIFFIRPRSYSKSERSFMPYERKRGAVIELSKLIKTGESSFDAGVKSLADNISFIKEVKYVITLDADTNLGIDIARDLIGKMIHPKNIPVIDTKSHKVISGYGIMQPKMSTDLDGARATPFSRLMCGGGGTDIYSGASFDLYQSLFGEGIFCGKGIFDVDAFYNTIVLSEFFPDDKILSHDILEGERLRTALLCDVELTDGFPKNELSYLKRKHRWIRGDIQNLMFLSKKIKVGNKKRKNDLSLLSKYKLFDNARRAVTPIISLAIIIVSFFWPQPYSAILFFAAFSPYIIPFVIDTITLITTLTVKSAARKFFSKGVTVGIWQSFLRMLYFSAMLAKDALMSLGACLTSAYRMLISKKKLLEWVTAAQSDSGKSSAMLFISKHIASSLLGAFLFFFAPGGLIKFTGLAFFIMPIVAFFTSKDFSSKKSISPEDKKKLSAYAADIWKFFDENVNKQNHFLPPDNIQFSPYEKTAHRTSPTNIGLYLSSCLAARDFGFINTAELYEKINASIETVEKLKKWKGHLYNWYDTESLSILNPAYISSVDSGNFVACLITVKNGLADYSDDEPRMIDLINRISRIASGTDFTVLYNKIRNLFSVGAVISPDGSAELDTGCYDFLMSEARILSYIAVSSRIVPKSHWKKLSRPLISSGGYIGLSSWSGTAFEYFMPDLFMPIRKGSLLYEAMLFAYRAQSSRRAGSVWGISESGFFAFDCDLNYQYKAFGVPLLGQKSGLDEDLVISPYSSFLALCVSVSGVLNNLYSLSKLGIYGKYGFYEAVDFTRSRVKKGSACVKSYMSHHLGMSMLALANASLDGIITKRFMLDGKMECGKELLEEKIPVNAVIKKLRKISAPHIQFEKMRPPEKITISEHSLVLPVPACLSDGKLSCIISDCGQIMISKNGVNLCSYSEPSKKFIADAPVSLYCYLKLDGRVYGMTPLAYAVLSRGKYSFSYSECSVIHSFSCEKGDFSLSYTIDSGNRSLLRIKLSGIAKAEKADFRFVFFPCLSDKDSYGAHPAFSELFIESSYDKSENIIFYKRRRRISSEEELILAVALSDKNCSLSFSAKRSLNMPGSFINDPFMLFEEKNDGDSGACINPLCKIGSAYDGRKGAELLLVMTHSAESAKEAILSARKSSFENAERALSETASQFALGAGISSVGNDGAVKELLSDIIYGDESTNNRCRISDVFFSDMTPHISIDSLWKYGISGDLPIIAVDIGGYFFPSPIEKRIRAFKLLTMKNVRCDLVIFYRETDKYDRKLEKKLRELISKCSAEGYIKRRRGGIHLIEKSSIGNDMIAFRLFASSYTDIYSDMAAKKIHRPAEKNFYTVIDSGKNISCPTNGHKVNGGYFSDGSFIIDKSENISLPWAHVLSGENISSVLTQNSLGYTFYKNAAERRITPWAESGNNELSGEKLFLYENGVLFDLTRCSAFVRYSCGKAEYFGRVAETDYKITVFCSSRLPAKIIKADFKGKLSDTSKIYFCVEPCMGRHKSKNAIKAISDSSILFKNPLSESFGNYFGFVSVFSSKKCSTECDKSHFYSSEKNSSSFKTRDFACVGTEAGGNNFSCHFIIGAAKDGSKIFEKIICAAPQKEWYEKELKTAENFCLNLIPKIKFLPQRKDDASESILEMFNNFLPYSAVFSRMLARSGFYQSGGAYGYRDQLQDCLSLVYSDPKRALNHLFRAAAHQFAAGDALHWWHAHSCRGVRTKCSDDYLWLPFTVSEICSVTGMYSILDTEIPYIEGEALADGVSEKYLPFYVSHLQENLYLHCIRAIDRACSLFGEHGLCLIGSCDWCDGYNLVGKDGKGESIWVSMFLICVIEKFIPICELRGESGSAEKYKNISQALKKAIIDYGYDDKNGYFIRGYYDDGTMLGAETCDEGKIDLLPQSFAPLCGMPEDISANAIMKAKEKLYDRDLGIMKLLDPPFDKTEKEPGYIKGYLKGVRENGGQYTHGALFYALGCFKCSDMLYSQHPETSEMISRSGGDILMYSNPAFRMSGTVSENIRKSYMAEPYAAAADIYSNADNPGRGGWTHYTGAAGWMYQLILKYVFGLAFSDICTDSPKIFVNTARYFPLPEIISGASVKIYDFGFDLTVKFISDGKKCVITDGRAAENGIITKNIKSAEIHF